MKSSSRWLPLLLTCVGLFFVSLTLATMLVPPAFTGRILPNRNKLSWRQLAIDKGAIVHSVDASMEASNMTAGRPQRGDGRMFAGVSRSSLLGPAGTTQLDS